MGAPPTNPIFEALAAQDAAAERAKAVQALKSPEQVLREHIAGQYRQAYALLAQVRNRRAWLRDVDKLNPGTSRFFSDHADIILPLVASHRKAIRGGKARLAALTAQARKAA